MTFIKKVKSVILNPSMFFQKIKAEVGIIEAFKYLIILTIIYTILSFVSMFFLSIFISSFLYGYSSPFTMPLLGFLSISSFIVIGFVFVAQIFFPFVSAAIMHLFTKIFGGKNDYSATYKVTVYSSTPTLLIGWIPVIGILALFYNWYLFIKGLSVLHDISMGRAFLVTLIPIIIIGVIVGALVYFWLSSILYTRTTPIHAIPTGQIYSILSKYFGVY